MKPILFLPIGGVLAVLLVGLVVFLATRSDSGPGKGQGDGKSDRTEEARRFLEQELGDWQSKGTDGGSPLMKPFFGDKLLEYRIVSFSPNPSAVVSEFKATVNVKLETNQGLKETQLRSTISYIRACKVRLGLPVPGRRWHPGQAG